LSTLSVLTEFYLHTLTPYFLWHTFWHLRVMTNDIICLSHLRWNFVYQRPQHLMSRFSKTSRVFFIEEPYFDAPFDCYDMKKDSGNVWIITPHYESNLSEDQIIVRQKEFVDMVITTMGINNYILWYYSPMAVEYTAHLAPDVVVFDCMDELSAFKFAHPNTVKNEIRVFRFADIVFTGGRSLFEAKRDRHDNIHLFPSSIDKQHFYTAREITTEPDDQQRIPHPRIGYYGVLDERIDFALIGEVAARKKDWQFVLIGPTAKIDTSVLPKDNNIHYLGMKDYEELPEYLAGWDIAMMPFAINEATRFISPTKTPEYLCGGKEVIATPVPDVVTEYGQEGLVHIATTADEFILNAEQILHSPIDERRLDEIDSSLSDMSWDNTWSKMNSLIEDVMKRNMVTAIKISSNGSL
jgi:glycosyltransferase involved in cell wall biosynthesis